MKTITVSLPDELVKHLEERVARGEFDSFDDALACAAASGAIPYSGKNRVTATTTDDQLRTMLQAGLDSYERGESVDGEVFMDELERDFEAKMTSESNRR